MLPTIRPGDTIRFRRDRRSPSPGEIWVFQRGSNYTVHRILWVRRDGSALFKGDACHRTDGFIPRQQLFGPVSAIRRGDRWFPANRRRDRLLGLTYSLTRTAAFLAARRIFRLGKRLAARAV
ncbi:MAG: S24/S26 family peptidase [Myxococcales bacterium]|jgi:hypothetical protein